jgi:winged helix DNA-binding protein
MTRRVSVEERRARLARRHHLAPRWRANDVETIAGDVVGLHATDPATVYLGSRARASGVDVAAVEGALYDDRSLVRMLGMRRTMFVVPVDLAALVAAACTSDIAATERRRFVQMLEGAGVARDGGRWLRRVEQATLDALEARGEAVAADLSSDVPDLRTKIPFGEGKKWAGEMGVSGRVLVLLAAEGRVVRGRPRGSWVSTQYVWSPMARWLGEDLPAMHATAARTELVRRWLYSYGPATRADIKWWTGWTMAAVTRALEDLDVTEVDADVGPAVLLSDDLDPVKPVKQWVAFLPSLDSTVMGWKERTWYLGEHGRALFDRNGNAGATVWWDGRIAGGWAQRTDGTIAFRLLEDIGREGAAAVAIEAGRLESWLADRRFTPKFPVPLHRELTA